MLLGMAIGPAGHVDCIDYMLLPNFPIQTSFLQTSLSWNSGMISATWVNLLAGAGAGVMSIPMLVGPQSGSPPAGSGSGQTTSPQNPSNVTTPTTMTLADVAAGVWDTLFTSAFQTIATARPACILRIGWEPYLPGTWAWSGIAQAAAHQAAYQHLVTLARSVSSSFKFDWNGAFHYTFSTHLYNPITDGAWPGASYVDYMGMDAYQNLGSGANVGAASWAYILNNMESSLAFAAAQGIPFSFPEWGLTPVGSGGSGDDPAYILAVWQWLRANQSIMGYACLFNDSPGVELAQAPNSGAVYPYLFGAWARQLGGQVPYRFATSTGYDRLRVA